MGRFRLTLAFPAVARGSGPDYVHKHSRQDGGSDMPDRLTAIEIENQEFSRKVRGYAPEEVRMYLRSIGEEVQRLNLENADLRADHSRLEEQIREIRERERTLQETLVSAQKMAGEMREQAKQEADVMLREARVRAERLFEQAQDQLARIEDEIRRARLERERRRRHANCYRHQRCGGDPRKFHIAPSPVCEQEDNETTVTIDEKNHTYSSLGISNCLSHRL